MKSHPVVLCMFAALLGISLPAADEAQPSAPRPDPAIYPPVSVKVINQEADSVPVTLKEKSIAVTVAANTALPVTVKVPNYEYKVEVFTNVLFDQLQTRINATSAAGWRVVGVPVLEVHSNGASFLRAIVVYEKPKA